MTIYAARSRTSPRLRAAPSPTSDRSAGAPAAALGRLILSAYYRDDRVLLALGHEARAPFPKGYDVEQGDWSLLDPVRARPRMYRVVE